jgi:hypothetical protein
MASSLLGLAPGGGYLDHRYYYRCRWSLTPPFHHHPLTPTPLPLGEELGVRVAVCFCGPHPAGWLLAEASPPRVLSDAVLYGVRTFLDPDNAEPRSPNRPEAVASYPQGRSASTRARAANRFVPFQSSQPVMPPFIQPRLFNPYLNKVATLPETLRPFDKLRTSLRSLQEMFPS